MIATLATPSPQLDRRPAARVCLACGATLPVVFVPAAITCLCGRVTTSTGVEARLVEVKR